MVLLYWEETESRSGQLALVADTIMGATVTTTLELMHCLSLIRKTRLSFSSLARSTTLSTVVPWSSWLILLEEAVTLQIDKVINWMNGSTNEEWIWLREILTWVVVTVSFVATLLRMRDSSGFSLLSLDSNHLLCLVLRLWAELFSNHNLRDIWVFWWIKIILW